MVADSHQGSPPTYTTFPAEGRLVRSRVELSDGERSHGLAAVLDYRFPHAPAAVRGTSICAGRWSCRGLEVACLLRAPASLGPESRLIVLRPELGRLLRRPRGTYRRHCRAERRADRDAARGTEVSVVRVQRVARRGTDLRRRKLDGELLSILEARRLLPCLERAVAAAVLRPTVPVLHL